MSYNFSAFKEQTTHIEEWLRKEFAGIRTGRATPAVLDTISVEAYGTFMTLKETASVTVEEARTLRVIPWDLSLVKAIEKAIMTSSLGLSVSVDDKGLRVIFPELTSERREGFVKIAKAKLEEARVTLRTEREKVQKDIDQKEKAGGMGEDDKFRYKAELQKMVDDTGKVLDELFAKKEKEILE